MAMMAMTGADDVTAALGGPLTLNVAAGSSLVEPGAVPANNLTLTFSSWSEIASICGQSRLDGE